MSDAPFAAVERHPALRFRIANLLTEERRPPVSIIAGRSAGLRQRYDTRLATVSLVHSAQPPSWKSQTGVPRNPASASHLSSNRM